jgi:hypothetical protein
MITLLMTEALRRATQRCVWFDPPEHAIRDPVRLAAYILTYGAYEDTQALRDQISVDDLRDLLDQAPPGILTRARGLTGISWRAGSHRRHCLRAPSRRWRSAREILIPERSARATQWRRRCGASRSVKGRRRAQKLPCGFAVEFQ